MERKKAIKLFGALLGLGLMLQGCASVTNPYEKDFSCPRMENGKCVGVDTAYKDSLQKDVEKVKTMYEIEQEEKRSNEEVKKIENYYPSLEDRGSVSAEEDLTPEKLYYAEQYFNKLTKILKEPKTPVMVMPSIARILILPYQENSGKTLYFSRYVYVILDEPKWVLDNLLFDLEKEKEE